MLSRNNSFFDPELCLNGHYIITGLTNDRFCSDSLELTDVVSELHRYLRHEQGFDAVFVMDRQNMCFCLDQQSFDILNGTDTAVQSGSESASTPGLISAGGPLPSRSRRRTDQSAHTMPNTSSGSLNLGRRSMDATWQQVSAAMKYSGRRCALIIKNANTMVGGADFLLELSSNYDRNHSIVVYLFRETDICNVGCVGERASFARDILIPRIEAEDPMDNRVISLRTPNSKEVRNLLNRLRLDPETHVPIRVSDIHALGDILSASCSRKKWGLVNLLNRLTLHASAHPGSKLSTDTWQEFTDEVGYLSPVEQLRALIGQDAIKERLFSWLRSQKDKGDVRTEPVSCSRFSPIPALNRRLGHSLNVRLKGSAGTGKTTIARLLGRFYYEAGLLTQGHCVECSGADIISGYVGETPSRMRQLVQRAMGGVLFIDEAYALLGDTHGDEAINQLVNDMSTYEGQFAVVIAGYPHQIDELIASNDGLARRFPEEYVLQDYTAPELKEIFFKFAKEDPDEIIFSDRLMARLDDFFDAFVCGKRHGWGNAGEAQNLFIEMKRLCGKRQENEGNTAVGYELGVDDIPERLRHCLTPPSKNITDALERIDAMIGLHGVKRFLRERVQNIVTGSGNQPKNFVFYGPPGTGKTTVARKFGELLGLMGIVNRRVNNVVEIRASELLNGRVQLQDSVADARGGILLIDEFHQMDGHPQGQNIIHELVPLVEDPEIRADTCFILAGYSVETKRTLKMDPGLRRRFPEINHVRFSDYSAAELVTILEGMLADKAQSVTPEYLIRCRMALEEYMKNRPHEFGNGGFIRDTFIPGCITARSKRLAKQLTGDADAIPDKEQLAKLSEQDKTQLIAEDLAPDMAQLAGPVGRYKLFDNDTAMDNVCRLLGKDEIISFARSRVEKTTEFFDTDRVTGLNYAIIGPAGSGRHTAARALAALWRENNMLDNDNVRCAAKVDFEAGYMGQTALKTREVIDQAEGGTLIIEQPSTLVAYSKQENSFGPAALGVIASALSDHRTQRSIVLIDTEDGFKELEKAVPSVRSSLAGVFLLDDLTPGQMAQIFEEKTRDSFHMDSELKDLLPDFFVNWVTSRGGRESLLNGWNNGAEVDRLIDEMILEWQRSNGETIEETHEENGFTFTLPKRMMTRKHIPQKYSVFLNERSVVSSQAMNRLMELPGLHSVKASIKGQERRMRRLSNTKPGCYLYLGNPGTGKTTVAKLMGGVLKAAGCLEQGHVVYKTARQICQQHDEFEIVLKQAKGGVLMIDESHQLVEKGNYWGNDIIKKLLTVLEDDAVTDTTCIVLAGYSQQMMDLLAADPGFQSRFGSEDCWVHFDDYNVDELEQIMEHMCRNADTITAIGANTPLRFTPDFAARAREIFSATVAVGDRDFGNARFVRTFLHDALSAQLLRFDNQYGVDGDPPESEVNLLTLQDIPERFSMVGLDQRPRVELASAKLKTDRSVMITEINYDQCCTALSESVVLLEVYRNGKCSGSGTGTIITTDGLVMTCEHVARGADEIRGRIYCPGAAGGDYRWLETEILEPVCKDCDMVLLRLKGSRFTAASIRPRGESPRVGEQILLLGYPLGDILTKGDTEKVKISNFAGRVASNQQCGAVERTYIDCTALHGCSGSPVFSRTDGRVIGVFSGSVIPQIDSSLDELNYFHPINYLWDKFVDLNHDNNALS